MNSKWIVMGLAIAAVLSSASVIADDDSDHDDRSDYQYRDAMVVKHDLERNIMQQSRYQKSASDEANGQQSRMSQSDDSKRVVTSTAPSNDLHLNLDIPGLFNYR